MTFLFRYNDVSFYVYITGLLKILINTVYMIHAILLKNDKIGGNQKIIILILVIVLPTYWGRLDGFYLIIYRYFLEGWKIIIGIMLILTYGSLNPEITSFRIKRIITVWTLFGGLTTFTGFLNIFCLTLYYFNPNISFLFFNGVSGLVFISFHVFRI